MGNVAYVKVFLSWMDDTRKLKDAEKGRLIDAMVAYANGDTDVDSRLTGNEAYVFPIFQARIDRDQSEYDSMVERNRENGRKGGRPPKASGISENRPVFSETQKSQEEEKEEEKENTLFESVPPKPPKAKASGKFTPPTLEEVIDYCKSRGSNTDPVKFYEYFATGNWHDAKGQPVRNWKQKLLTWEKYDSQKAGKKIYSSYTHDDPPDQESYARMEKLLAKMGGNDGKENS